MTALLAVEVTLRVEGEPVLDIKSPVRYCWPEDLVVEEVRWRVTGYPDGHVIVGVTAFGRGHANRSWYRPSPILSQDLNTSPPPEWVPAAPAWFEAVVEEMHTATEVVPR